MFFLLRLAFWIGLVLVILPTGKTQQETNPAPQVGATEAVTAATAAMSDLGGFCTRQPAACEIGGHAAAVIGQRAQAGARTVYEFISEKSGKGDKAEPRAEASPEKTEAKPEPKIETKAAAKHETKPEKKPVKAAKKNPDHTGSIGEHIALDTDGVPAFDNAPAGPANTMPDWSISGVETIVPLLP